jgi:ribosomal-protein-alanine N-acetyltransferase
MSERDTQHLDVTIRPMEMRDLAEVHAIDVLSFSLPWSERSFRFELTENQTSRQWVATVPDPDGNSRLVGVIVVWFIIDEAHIGTFAVHPDYRRQGIGRALMEHTLNHARQTGMVKVFLEVRRGNLPAIELYKSYGFTVQGLRPRYYTDNNEDALLMEMEIGKSNG